MVVHTGTRRLKIIWNLIEENSEENYKFSNAEKRVLNTHIDLGHRGFTVRKCKRFRVFIDLELLGNLSLIYYNPLVA